MGTISTGIGLVSGINSADIIDKLIQLERQPIDNIQVRIDKTNQTQSAFADLAAKLDALKTSGTALRKPSTFGNVAVTSSDEAVLKAEALPNTAEGSYSFRVARLVQSQQLATADGFATSDKTAVGATSVTLELGDSRLKEETNLDALNNGRGVRRGIIEIVDRTGRIAQVDLGDAVTLDDVAEAINRSGAVDVSASVGSSRLVLTNNGGGTGKFRVSDLTGHASRDLGIFANVAGDAINGSDLAKLTGDTPLADLNDGRGVVTGAGDGLSLTLRDGSKFNVSLAGASTVGEAQARFNAASGGKAYLDITGDRALRVTDNTAGTKNIFGQPNPGTGTTVVAGLNGSKAADDLRLAGSSTSGTVQGGKLVAEYGSVLTSSLFGGKGFAGGKIAVQSAGSATATTIDLTGAADVAEIIDRVAAANAGVEARVNAAGNGIDLLDTSNGGADLNVTDLGGGTAAADLGWAGPHSKNADGQHVASGANLQRAWFRGDTKLADLNGGAGVPLGKVKVTDSKGVARTIDFGQGAPTTVADAIAKFNAAGVGVTAGINDNGDGLVLSDTAGGAAALKVEDVEGATAKTLRLAGTATGGKIDGSFEVKVDLAPGDSLEQVRDKINNETFAARAEVLQSGGAEPFRLSLVGRQGGALGAFVFDARAADGSAALGTTTINKARDAAVFVGSKASDAPLLVTGRSNHIADVVPGLTLDLQAVSDQPTTVTISRDVASVKEQIGAFVDGFNTLRKTIDDNSKYDDKTQQRGILLGEPVVSQIERQVYGLTNKVFDSGNPKYRILADIGVRVGAGATLEFNQDKFDKAWADDPEAVTAFFTADGTGLGHLLQNRIGDLTDPVDGVLTKAEKTLTDRTTNFQGQIARLEDVVAAKKTRLQKQYAGLETALSQLQYQQGQLGNIGAGAAAAK